MRIIHSGIMVTDSDLESRTLFQCISRTETPEYVDSSCHIGGVQYLKENTERFLQDFFALSKQEASRGQCVVFEKSNTFWGVFNLNW